MAKRSSNEWDELQTRVRTLRLWGLDARWNELKSETWVRNLVEIEESERLRRSLDFRLKSAKIGRFKPIDKFDWSHPTKIDRMMIEGLFDLNFMREESNVILVGSNGLGKSMLAKNLAYRAVVEGHTVKFINASDLLVDLSAQSGASLERRLKHYVKQQLLVIDEVGYLSYDNRHADLLFQVVSRRYESGAPIVVTTNKPFGEWNEVFSSSACVTTLVDRLCHRAEIVKIEGDSYRARESKSRAKEKRKSNKRKSPPKSVE